MSGRARQKVRIAPLGEIARLDWLARLEHDAAAHELGRESAPDMGLAYTRPGTDHNDAQLSRHGVRAVRHCGTHPARRQ